MSLQRVFRSWTRKKKLHFIFFFQFERGRIEVLEQAGYWDPEWDPRSWVVAVGH